MDSVDMAKANETPGVERIETDILVIGGGSGGLSVAAGASQMGARTVLIEKGKMGGDCLNYGCVPSKALLAAGHAADAVRHASAFGITAGEPEVEDAKVFQHVLGAIKTIEPHDSVERFESLGVNVIQAPARFVSRTEVAAGGRVITAKRIVVATGSSPAIPPIPGLDEVDYLTNETIFYRDTLPDHLLVIGGGVIGVEMAQAHRHLGSDVTVIEMGRIMANDDPELVDVVREQLIEDGVSLQEGVKVVRVEKTASGVAVIAEKDGEEVRLDGSHVLVAAGRRPNVDGLDLEKAGVTYDRRGIKVDGRLRTTNKKVFAIGDVAGGLQFTHVAGYHAGIVIKNALFHMPAKANHDNVPWVTFTTPEVAQVGLTEEKARAAGHEINILRWPYAENDRAIAEGKTKGFLKAVVTPKGKILGVGIAGAHAGELIQPWVLAMSKGLKVGDVAQTIAPYPTLGEISKRAAGSFYTPKLFSEKTRKIVRFLLKFA